MWTATPYKDWFLNGTQYKMTVMIKVMSAECFYLDRLGVRASGNACGSNHGPLCAARFFVFVRELFKL